MIGHCLQVQNKLPSLSFGSIHSESDTNSQGFILLLPQAAVLFGSDAGSDGVEPTLGFVIQNCQTLCSMWCLMDETWY